MSSQIQRKQALSRAAAAPLRIINPNPPRYLFNNTGDLIGEQDIPDRPPSKSREGPGELPAGSIWVPKHSKSTANVLDSPPSPPDSPLNSPIPDEDTETTPTGHKSGKTVIGLPPFTPTEAEQSSADESSPLKQRTAKPMDEAMATFRKMDDDRTDEGEDADDEASEMSDASCDDDGGIARNEHDEGMGVRLEKVEIGSKRFVRDEEEEASKKTRTKEDLGDEEL